MTRTATSVAAIVGVVLLVASVECAHLISPRAQGATGELARRP